jgi:hypothetical protein
MFLCAVTQTLLVSTPPSRGDWGGNENRFVLNESQVEVVTGIFDLGINRTIRSHTAIVVGGVLVVGPAHLAVESRLESCPSSSSDPIAVVTMPPGPKVASKSPAANTRRSSNGSMSSRRGFT